MTAEAEKILVELKPWMADYMRSFYTDDAEVSLGIKIKEKHTDYVARHCRELAEHLELNENDAALAEMVGLFHDVGRFRQYTIYKTFNDSRSEDHADLGLKVLGELNVLKDLPAEDRELVEFAIGNHNKRFIAETDDKKKILFARLIRDADKLDIYRVLEPFLSGDAAKEGPNFVTSSDSDGISPNFLRHFERGEQADYHEITTQGDRRIVRLLWVYDIHFAWTMKKIVQAGYIDRIKAGFEPLRIDMSVGFERLERFVREKCAADDRELLTR